LLLLFKAPLGAALILFSFSHSEYSLIGLYLGLYLLIGSSSVVESTLLNQVTPSSHRASILSLFSLVLQIGGVIASVGGFLVSTYSRYQNMWLIAGALLLVTCAAVAVLQKRIARLTPQPLQETVESAPPLMDDIIEHI
jgi:MFS family permease